MTKIQLTADLSKYDFQQADCRIFDKVSPWLKHFRCAVFVLVTGGLVLAIYLFWRSATNIADAFAIILCIWFGLSYLLSVLMRLRISEERQDAAIRDGDNTITFDDEGMRIENSGMRLVYFWHHVKDVIDGPDGLLVLITSLKYQPIPARDLPQGMEQDELKARIKDWISKSRQEAVSDVFFGS